MARLVLLALALVVATACGAPESVESDAGAELPAPSFGAADARLLAAIETSVERWNAVACLGLQVSDTPTHVAVFGEPREGRMAEAMGQWSSATIRVLDDALTPWSYAPETLEQLVLHEMAHVLARTNDHVSDGALGPGRGDGALTDATLTAVCSSSECGCFTPEAP